MPPPPRPKSNALTARQHRKDASDKAVLIRRRSAISQNVELQVQ